MLRYSVSTDLAELLGTSCHKDTLKVKKSFDLHEKRYNIYLDHRYRYNFFLKMEKEYKIKTTIAIKKIQ